MQSLYICIPPVSAAEEEKEEQAIIDSGPHHPRRGLGMMPVSGRINDAVVAVPTPSSGCSLGSTPTAGNRLVLLCSCGGNCLNPAPDHIGRCDASCS
jgi:hypothetical protein